MSFADFRAGEDGSFEGTQVACVPLDPSAEPLPALTAVMAEVAEGFDGEVGFWGPVPLPRSGALFSIQWWDRSDDLTEVLSEVHRGLAEAGVACDLRSFRGAAPVFERDPAQRFQGVAVVLCPRLRADAVVGVGRVRMTDVEGAALEACLERLATWCSVPDGRYYAQFAAGGFEVAGPDRASIIRRSLVAEEIARLTCERWPEERRTGTVDSEGNLVLVAGRAGSDGDVSDLLVTAVDTLRQFGDAARYGCAFRVDSPVGALGSALQHNWPGSEDRQAHRWSRTAQGSGVPDAFPAQLVTAAHGRPVLDPHEWAVLDASGGATVLATRRPEGWLGAPRPAPGVLDRARAAFAPLLWSPPDV